MLFNTLSLDQKIIYICANEYKYFLKKPNVLGVGLGYKIKNGLNTLEKCIKVFVVKKMCRNNLTNSDLIPTYYKNITIDVEDIGIMYSSSLTSKIRPVLCGYSIGPVKALAAGEINFGTLGCLVTDGTYKYLLSNNHILANENHLSINSPIIQPAFDDSGRAPRDTIAHLSKFIPLKFGTTSQPGESLVDCAIARIDNESFVSTSIAKIGHIQGIILPTLGEPVQKTGRTSELTTGKITSLAASINVKYTYGSCILKNQIVSTKMSDFGDSGGLLVDNDNYALGLLAASSTSKTLYNPIKTVLSSLQVALLF